MENKKILPIIVILILIFIPLVASLECDECSKGCEVINGNLVCKENIMNTKPASNFILPVGITLLIIGTILIIYLKVLKSKKKIKTY